MRLKVPGLVCGIWLLGAFAAPTATVSAPSQAPASVNGLLAQEHHIKQQVRNVHGRLVDTNKKMKETEDHLLQVQKQLSDIESRKEQQYKELSKQYGILMVPVVSAFNDNTKALKTNEQKLMQRQKELQTAKEKLSKNREELRAKHTEGLHSLRTITTLIAKTTKTPYKEGTLEGLDLEKLANVFLWPVPATKEISSDYGWRQLNGEFEFHTGIDVAAAEGDPIHASADGIVLYAGAAKGFGNWIVLKHDHGLLSVYGHMYRSGILVRPGQRVKKGQVIGRVGAAGESYGPHLHFAVARGMDGNELNTVSPWAFLEK